jgi:hypothetical protein
VSSSNAADRGPKPSWRRHSAASSSPPKPNSPAATAAPTSLPPNSWHASARNAKSPTPQNLPTPTEKSAAPPPASGNRVHVPRTQSHQSNCADVSVMVAKIQRRVGHSPGRPITRVMLRLSWKGTASFALVSNQSIRVIASRGSLIIPISLISNPRSSSVIACRQWPLHSRFGWPKLPALV